MRSAPAEATTRDRATLLLLMLLLPALLLLMPLLPALLLATAAVPALGAAALDESLGIIECAHVFDAYDDLDEMQCGDVRLQFDVDSDWMTIVCEQNGTFTCEDLREARPLFDKYMIYGDFSTNRNIRYLAVRNCILPSEQLRCPLWLVGADDAVRLTLSEVQGTLLPLHMRGIQAVETVHIEYRAAGNNTTFSYEALSKLRSLRSLYVSTATLVLEPDADHFPVWEQLNTLELVNVCLRSLPRGGFRNTPNVVSLSLEYNDIEYIDEGAFLGLPRLGDMTLANNRALRELPAGVFRGLPLQYLTLSSNALRRLPADLFCGQDRLQLLYLQHNALETLDESLFSPLSQLLELNLTGNRLQQLSTATFHIPTLERLDLSRNNLSLSCSNGSHGSPYSAQSLRKLDLSHNRVSALCEEWRVSRRLRELELSYNELTSLSSEDTTFFNDAKVHVQHNRIRHFHLDYSRSSESNPILFLGHNPVMCDCELHAALAARAAGRVRLDVAGATCADPPSLRNASLAALAPNPPTCVETACPSGCQCVTHSLQSQVEVECQTLPLAFSPKLKMFSKRLRLARASGLLRLPSAVSYFNLSGLNLTEAPRVNGSEIEIDLSYNQLKDFPVDLLNQNCTLHLANNPFDCNCDKRDRFEFLEGYWHLVKDYWNVTCDTGTLVSRLDIDLSCTAQVGTIIGFTVAVLGVLVAVVTAAAYRYKTEIRILLRMLGLWRGKDEVDDKPYDAFVSFAYQDQRYVEETLVPALEGGRRPLRLLLHHRDWVVGDFIPTQIASSVDDSRRTIIVLSRHFLQSAWAQMEFQTAHGSDKLIILMLDDADELQALCAMDADLRAYLALNTYVRADDPLVFERLKDAVLRRRKAFARTRERTDVQMEETKM